MAQDVGGGGEIAWGVFFDGAPVVPDGESGGFVGPVGEEFETFGVAGILEGTGHVGEAVVVAVADHDVRLGVQGLGGCSVKL